MRRYFQLITMTTFFFGVNSFAFAQGNAQSLEQITEKLKALEAMSSERIKEEVKRRFNDDLEHYGGPRGGIDGFRHERIGRYLEDVERAQERSFAEVRDSIDRQSGESKQQMRQQLEKAESFWEQNIAKIKEIYSSQTGR